MTRKIKKQAALVSVKKVSARKTRAQAQACVLLSENLDMRGARELKRGLEVLFRGLQPCILDASAVVHVSTGCAQILAAFARSMNASAVKVTLRKPTVAMLKTFEQLGMAGALATCALEA